MQLPRIVVDILHQIHSAAEARSAFPVPVLSMGLADGFVCITIL